MKAAFFLFLGGSFIIYLQNNVSYQKRKRRDFLSSLFYGIGFYVAGGDKHSHSHADHHHHSHSGEDHSHAHSLEDLSVGLSVLG